jgi:hypothetical protein
MIFPASRIQVSRDTSVVRQTIIGAGQDAIDILSILRGFFFSALKYRQSLLRDAQAVQ